MNQENRGHWYLLTGLIIGLVVGLLYAWLISPVEYVDTEPGSLAAPYKEAYRIVIALAYQSEGDIGRARERILLIDPEDPVRALAAQAQRMIAANAPPSEARALSVLASDLGKPQTVSSVSQVHTPTGAPVDVETPQAAAVEQTPLQPVATIDPGDAIRTATPPPPTTTPTAQPTPTITFTPMPTFTPRPTATSRIIPDAPFALSEQEQICDRSIPAGLLVVEALDAQSQPLPGVRVVVTWQDGESVFYTGFAPEISLGYADFRMSAGIEYSIKVGDASEQADPVSSAGNCAWRLEYIQK